MTVNVYHKHSVVKDKAPDVKQLELGEVGINANQDSPALYIKDSADVIRQVGGDIPAIEEELKRLDFVIKQLQDVIDILDNVDGEGLQKLVKSLVALEAQVLLLAEHNVEQDRTLQALTEADITLKEQIDNLTSHVNKQIEDLLTAVKALEAQVLLSAKHNAEQDSHLDRHDKALLVHEEDINALVKRIEALEEAISLNVESLEKRIESLEAMTLVAGVGIKVVVKDASANPYGFTVKIDKEWLDGVIATAVEEALKPYALKDFSENTPELDDA